MKHPSSELAEVMDGEHSRRLGLSTIAREGGRVDVAMPFGAAVSNRRGRVHGGATASAMVAAARIAALSSETSSTPRSIQLLQTSLSFLAPPKAASSVTATVTSMRRGRDVAHVEIGALDDDGSMVARGLFSLAFRSIAGPRGTGIEKRTDELSPEEAQSHGIPHSPYLSAADVRVPTSAPGVASLWMPVRPNGSAEDPTRIDDGALIALADSCVAYSAQRGQDGIGVGPGVTVSLSLLLHGVADELVEAEGHAEKASGRCHCATVVLRTKRTRRLVGTAVGVFHVLRMPQ